MRYYSIKAINAASFVKKNFDGIHIVASCFKQNSGIILRNSLPKREREQTLAYPLMALAMLCFLVGGLR
jgi:hypothetical protein